MGLHYEVLRARPDRTEREDSIRRPHPEAIHVRAAAQLGDGLDGDEVAPLQ